MKLHSAIATMALLAAAAQAQPPGTVAQPVLELRALDKITGRASVLMAPLNVPVKFASLTIVARSCYSTPASETPVLEVHGTEAGP